MFEGNPILAVATTWGGFHDVFSGVQSTLVHIKKFNEDQQKKLVYDICKMQNPRSQLKWWIDAMDIALHVPALTLDITFKDEWEVCMEFIQMAYAAADEIVTYLQKIIFICFEEHTMAVACMSLIEPDEPSKE